MDRIVISTLIISGSLVWAVVAVRKLRGKPLVPSAGVPEEVPLLAVLFAAAWAAQALLAQFAEPRTEPLELTGIKNAVALSGAVAFVLAVAYSAGNKTQQRSPMPTVAAIGLGLTAFLASTALVLMIQIGLQRWLGPDPSPHLLLEFLRANRSIDAVLWVGASAIVTAPLLEELLYRVILQSALKTRIGERPAIVVVAVLFCAVHGWPEMLGLLPLALVLGYVYARTNNYLAVVTAHAAFNLSMLLLTGLSA